MNIANIRLLNQQLVSPQESDVHSLVSAMGMLQAQDYRMMRWAVGMRMKKPSMCAVREAYDSGRIIRAHLFRCTWQLVAAEDYRWMLNLCSARNKAAISGFLAGRGLSLPAAEYCRACDAIVDVLGGGKSMLRADLIARLRDYGIREDAGKVKYCLLLAEIEGLVCSGKLDGRQATYALVDDRVPPGEPFPREESVAMLASRYFRSHSPATIDDFAWWSGLGLGECRAAIAAIRGELMVERVGGVEYYVHDACRVRGCRRQALLLPPYDEYLLGYKSRHHVLEDEFRHMAYTNNGIFYPVIVVGGRIVGNWHPQRAATFFREEYSADLSAQLDRFRKFMGCRT